MDEEKPVVFRGAFSAHNPILKVYSDRIVYQEGNIRKTEKVILFSRITDVSLHKGLVIGGKLTIQTAGSSKAEIEVGLPLADKARDLIVERMAKT